MARSDIFIELTTEEIVVLCEAGGLGLPISLADEPLGNLTESRAALAKANAHRSLVARRAMAAEEDGVIRPIEAIRTILEVASSPGIIGLVTVELIDEEDIDVRTLAVLPELGVEARKVGTNLHRFTPFAPEDLVARIIRLLDLRPSGIPANVTFNATFGALEQCGEIVEAAGNDSLDAAVAALVGDGVATDAAEIFVEALSVRRGSTQIALFHKPNDTVMEGGSLSFIDAGLAGYWQTDALEPGDANKTAKITSVDAQSLAKQVIDFLPEAFGDRVPRGLQAVLKRPS
jgi:hypothetical protein